MANIRKAILDALETELTALTEIKIATQDTQSIDEAEESSPYVGIIAGEEVLVVEDDNATDIRWEMPVNLLLITEQRYTNIEALIKRIKQKIYDENNDLTLTNNVLAINIGEFTPVQREDIDDERYSSTQCNLVILYYTSDTDFV
jgi:hypothetical protein